MDGIRRPQLIIARKRAQLVDEWGDVVASMTTAKFVEALTQWVPNVTPILPPGAIYYEKLGQYQGIILQEPPAVRRVPYTIYPRRNELSGRTLKGAHYLAFPYVILGFCMYGGSIRSSLVAFRNKPVSSPNDKLFFSNLWNATGYDICVGQYSRISAKTISEAAEIVRRAFWHNDFTPGVGGMNYEAYAPQTTGLVEEWVKWSKSDPMFVLKIKWAGPPNLITIGGLAKRLRGLVGLVSMSAARCQQGSPIKDFTGLVRLYQGLAQDKSRHNKEGVWLG